MLTPPAPVAVAVAPNGGRKTRADHPALPVTPAELARTAADCANAGASMIHVHVRDSAGRHLLDAAAYRKAIDAIRDMAGPEIVIQITSESLGLYTPAEQMQVVLDTGAEAVSLALREIAPTEAEVPALARFLDALRAARTVPQIILYDRTDLDRLLDLRDRGVLPFADVPILLALGRYSDGQTARPASLRPFLDGTLDRFGHWSCCAFGRFELMTVSAAALFGGHVRVGFENNLDLPGGRRAADNAALVDATVNGLRGLGLKPATASDLRTAFAACIGQ